MNRHAVFVGYHRVTESRNFRSSGLVLLGVLACAGYGGHAGYYILSGNFHDIFWTCHVAALLVGVGLILGSPLLNGAGLLCLTIGLPMWFLYLLDGGEFFPTTLLTHVLGLGVGLAGARILGFPRHGWIAALAFVALLLVAARLFTPREPNVNLAYGPLEGLSLWSVGGVAHWALLLVQWAVALAVLQGTYRWFFRGRLGE